MNQIQKREHVSDVLSIMVTISASLILIAAIINDVPKTTWLILALSVLTCIPLAFIIWSLVRIKKSNLDQTTKALWSLVILLFPVLGAIVSIYMTSEEKDING